VRPGTCEQLGVSSRQSQQDSPGLRRIGDSRVRFSDTVSAWVNELPVLAEVQLPPRTGNDHCSGTKIFFAGQWVGIEHLRYNGDGFEKLTVFPEHLIESDSCSGMKRRGRAWDRHLIATEMSAFRSRSRFEVALFPSPTSRGAGFAQPRGIGFDVEHGVPSSMSIPRK
jgi:hypothetical protein